MSVKNIHRAEECWKVRVDTGGTFTDGWALSPDGDEHRCKLLSSSVIRVRIEKVLAGGRYQLGRAHGVSGNFLRGFQVEGGGVVDDWNPEEDLLSIKGGPAFARGDALQMFTGEEAPVLALRILTSTPLGNPFPDVDFRVSTTKATNALLERRGRKGVLITSAGFEDLLRIGDQRRPHLFDLRQSLEDPVFDSCVGLRGRIDASGRIVEPLSKAEGVDLVTKLKADSIEVVAVALLNSYANPVHEQEVRDWLREAGISSISLSTDLTSAIRLLPRAETATANAYLSPVMDSFVAAISRGMNNGSVELLTSGGGLKDAADYRPIDSLLSGPAGGVRGAMEVARSAGYDKVISFDMGGTSSDISRINGAPILRYEQKIGPARVAAPSIKIETVAAGGGSICQWSGGALAVGPESAGADPGPACYGKGGPLTVTDVNLLLGLMDPTRAGIPLDVEAAWARLHELQSQMEHDGVSPGSEQQLLEGLREIAIERMAEAIRKVSIREGCDPSTYALVAFGGAGPQHACGVAAKIGIREILIPGDAGLLSARGLHHCSREKIVEHQVLSRLDVLSEGWVERVEALIQEALEALGEGGALARILCEMRLWGQDSTLELEMHVIPERDELERGFLERYRELYGYDPPAGKEIELVALRVVARVAERGLLPEEFGPALPVETMEVIQDAFRTCVIEPGWSWAKGSRGGMHLVRQDQIAPSLRTLSSGWSQEIEAELFRCRFEGLVEEMGELLRRTAMSPNIKERLDFSCALLDAAGRLVVNAPHIPVHLGAIGLCVRKVGEGRKWKDGDMVMVNHPAFGGSHLPDVTLISPVFFEEGLIGFIANRAHHAEIGGKAPGSMPAEARCLEEEGVVIPPILICESGRSRFKAIEDLFRSSRYPSRMLGDNLADLAAQIACNHHGVRALQALARGSSCDVVLRNMEGLRHHASQVMRSKLAPVIGHRWHGEDVLDDGTRIQVLLRGSKEGLHVDFSGSGPVHAGNLNATEAIVRSAVLYVLRAWVGDDLPLNEGLLDDVRIKTPEGILSPVFTEDPAICPAVVGGNVETSQRVVDVLLDALDLQANSQGTMNNFLFGNTAFAYYETIGGGSGAGPGWCGLSGTHVHMSNTAITDPEILERRFPVRILGFSLRDGSGGRGHWDGGCGLQREFEFLEDMTVSMLTQRRRKGPRGKKGGAAGLPGRQFKVRVDGTREELPAICSVAVKAGERVLIQTPGGGGWGKV